jgi:chloramphenicol-sensitive protein RarD
VRQQLSEQWVGVAAAAGAYILWGFLPIYWKLLGNVTAGEILAHRIVWSVVFMVIILALLGKISSALREIAVVISQPKQLFAIVMAAIFISFNWFAFIWAVSHDRMVESSLGYYINPLVSVLLGIVFFKEKLNFWQVVSFLLAASGVVYLVYHFGQIPWVAITLALSFGLYGLFKKLVQLGAMTGLTIETLLITPFALFYLFYFSPGSSGFLGVGSLQTLVLLIGAGAVTAVPLLLFASGVRRIPLYMIGFLQYISPTLILILGVFLYGEPFTHVHVISFLLIWTALLIFMLARSRLFLRMEPKIARKKAV